MRHEKWVEGLHKDFREEFERLSKLGVKFNLRTLRLLALDVLRSGNGEEYSTNKLEPKSETPLYKKITLSWIQSFTSRYRIVSCARTGKNRMSPPKEEDLGLSVAIHLDLFSGLFISRKLDKNDVENADEKHFTLKIDNGRTLGFFGAS